MNRHALQLPPDGSRSMHEVWLLLDDALAGRQREALERQGRVDRSSLADLHRLLLLLAEALLQRHGEGGGPKAARAAISKLLGGEPAFRKDRLLRRLARRSVLVLARSTGGFRAWAWALSWLARL